MAAMREFELLVESCRRCFIGEQSIASPALLDSPIDWSVFLKLVRRHRVQGLAWEGLLQLGRPMPEHVAEQLESAATSVAEQNLRIAVESAGLLSDFSEQNLPLLFFKGLPLGALAYRPPLLKMGWDIDLLIAPEHLSSAAGLLTRRGYTPSIPHAAPESVELLRWHQRHKESVWHQREGNFHLDLHTRSSDNDSLIPEITVHSPAQIVPVLPGIELPALALDELFAYLTVHGASSAWFRLKWLADFAALLSQLSPQEVDRLYRESQRLQAGRAAGLALLLADRVFGIALRDALRMVLRRDRATILIESTAYRQLLADREPTERLWGTLPIHLSQFALLPGLGFKAKELRVQVGSWLYR